MPPSGRQVGYYVGADDSNEEANLYIRFPRIWEDFVEVTWGRQIFDGYKPLKYQLCAEGDNYRIERYFGATENTFRLQGLSPDQTLRVQVRVLVDTPSNTDAISAPAAANTTSSWMPWASANVTTLPSVTVDVATVGSNFIHGRFSFGAPQEQHEHNSAPTFDKSTPSHNFLTVKEIQFKMRDKGPFRSFEVAEKTFPADQREFTINELQPNLILEVEARAISSFGDAGQWCSPVRFLTLPAVEVSVVEIGETYAITKWEREPDEKNPFADDAGIAEMVMIVDILPSQRELDVDSQAKKQQVLAQSFGNESRMFRLRDLLPGRNYVIRSRYRNVLGDWAQWTLAPFTTLFPVEAPDVQLVGHNFIQVSWRRGFEGVRASTAEDDGRDVQQWEVRCMVGKAATTMILPKKETETKMVNLHSGVDYTIDARARNEAGEWGPWSAPLVATTLHRLLPRAEAAGDTWIEASWLRRDKVYQDNITRYHVQLSAVGNTFRAAKYFPPEVTNFTFADLRPNTKFVLVLQAFSDNHWGPWSEPVEVSTCSPAVPTLVRRGEDFVQLRWASDYYTRSNIDPTDRRYQLRIMRPKIPTAEEEQSIAERGGGVMQQSAAAPTEDVVEDTTQATLRIGHLPSFSRVNVQIRMFDFHRQAWGEWGEERSFRTLSSVIVATHIGENVAEISWSRNPRIMCAISDEEIETGAEDTLAPLGVTKYILRVNEMLAEGSHKEVGKYHFDEGQATLFSIAGLSPDSVYTVQLSYYDSSAAWSTPSAPLKFRTAPPLQICVTDISEGHAALRWGRWVGGEREIQIQENNFRIILEDLSMPSSVPLQQAVQGVTKYTVTDLRPSTLYRVSISAAMHIHSQYGAWSEPVYICTSSSMEVKLNLIGEDYSVLSWGRSAATVTALPNARFMTVAYDDGKNSKRSAPARNNDADGNVIYIGDATVLEHHIQLLKVLTQTGDDEVGRPATELVFDAKVHATQHSLRIPNLEPDTYYRAYVCVSSHSHQWGTWSPALEFHTAMPTAVYIAGMSPEAITVKWGKLEGSDEANSNVWRYQLRVDGVDEDYHTQVELEKDAREYVLKGLSLDACYGVSIRTHLDTEHDWGQWCKPMYVVVRRIPVDVVESAQNWTHVEWKSGFKLDAAPKAQFLSLLSSSSAAVTCLEPQIDRYIFRNLDPSTMYAAHLITVEQSSYPVKVLPSAPPLAGARGVQAKKIIGDSKHPPSFSIPIVAADFSQFLEEGFAFRTQRVLQLRAESIGQNHVLLHWDTKDPSAFLTIANNKAGDGAAAPAVASNAPTQEEEEAAHMISADDTFEIETVDGDSRRITKARGMYALIRSLKPSASIRCSVRWIAAKSEMPCEWSKPIVATMLPVIEPTLGPASPESGGVAGIGEDYLIFHWKRSLRNSNFQSRSDIVFEAKLRQLRGDGKSEDIIVTTKESGYHFTNLKADMAYDLQVRTVIPVPIHGVVESVKGEWSAPLACMTLSPIAAVAIDVTETAASICWKRRGADQAGAQGADGEGPSEGITSFRVRVIRLAEDGTVPVPAGSVGDIGNAGVIYDEQFTDSNEEFVSRLTKISGLRPGGKFSASVRASTGLIWGAWSEPFTFATNVSCEINLKLVADTFVAMEWGRPAYDGLGEVAALTAWEAAFETIGATTQQARSTGDCIVRVDPNGTQYNIGGLTANTAYSVKVRPEYGKEKGSWSQTRHFVTLAPLSVDVGRIGETFVKVEWRREAQTTIESRIRARNKQAAQELQAKLEAMKRRLQLLHRGEDSDADSEVQNPALDVSDDEAPLDINGLASDSEVATAEKDQLPVGALTVNDLIGGGAPGAKSTSRPNTANPNEEASDAYLKQQIKQLELKISNTAVVAAMKVDEMAKACVYPVGEDSMFELLIKQSFANPDGIEGYVFRKRLPRTENSFRIENLTPQTHYEVSVRALFTDGVDLTGFISVGLDDPTAGLASTSLAPSAQQSATPFTSLAKASDITASGNPLEGTMGFDGSVLSSVDTNVAASPTGVPWTVWCPKAAFVTLKPIVTKVKGIGSTSLVLEWDTGRIGGAGTSAGSKRSGAANNTSAKSASNDTESVASLSARTMGNEPEAASQGEGPAAGSALFDADEVDERAKTAITKFQIHLADVNEQPKDTITLADPAVREHVVANLRPNTTYIVAVRVCYDDDRWGVWSKPIVFMTMPALMAKLQSTAEKQVELLVWRDSQAESQHDETVIWCPPLTEHQLSINANPCAQPFTLEKGTSTLLTLDALAVDTEYRIAVQDKVLKYWQGYQEVLVCETIPHAPQRPMLKERKGPKVVIAWGHNQSMPDHHQYVYMLEMAIQEDPEKQRKSLVTQKRNEVLGKGSQTSPTDAGPRFGQFELLGFSETTEFAIELPIAIHNCYFRVQCCKTNQTVDGEDAPVARTDYHDPQSLYVENPAHYIWSRPSPIGHFRTPSVPAHPSGLHISNLTHNAAMLHWQKPANHAQHTGLVYRIHLNNSYQDRFTCIAETSETHLQLVDLVTNCHYRVAVTAESTMGVSVNNNTLHFSTRVVPTTNSGTEPAKARAANKAANSTVPARRALTAPEDVIISARHKAQQEHQAFAPLLDDTASTVFTAARMFGGSGNIGSAIVDGNSGRGASRGAMTPEPIRIISAVSAPKPTTPTARRNPAPL